MSALIQEDAPNKETLASAVYAKLRREIITAVLLPGDKLRMRELCERYEAGLSPVREALNRASRDGLVRQIDLRGFAVAPVSERDLVELTRARCWLAEVAIRESFARGDDAWEEGVVLAYHRMTRRPMYASGAERRINPAWEEAHRAFHLSMIASCGSARLIVFWEELFDAADRYRHLARIMDLEGDESSQEEHHALMEAAIHRRTDEVISLLREHLLRTQQLCLARLGDQELASSGRAAGQRLA